MSKILSQFGAIALIVIGLTVLSLASLLLRIKHIECQVGTQPCDATQVAQFNQVLGQPLLFFNRQKLLTATTANSQLTVGNLSFVLPDTIKLQLQQQQPAYRLATEGQAEPLLIATNGQVITGDSPTNLTTIFIPANIWAATQTTHQINPSFHEQLTDLLATLATNQASAPFLTWVDAQTVAVDNPTQPQIILDPSNLRTDLARLKVTQQAIQNQATASPNAALSQAAEIDVRFQLPVLRTAPSIPRHVSH